MKKVAEAQTLIDVMKFADGKTLPKEIQLVPVGEWDTLKYGKVAISLKDLKEMAENFNKGVRKGVPIDVDHDEGKAAGWITKVEARNDGLWSVDTDWTTYGEQLLNDRIYKFLSPEFSQTYTDPENSGLRLKNVLIAASLVNRPLFKELKSLVASEGENLTENKNGLILYFIEKTLENSNSKSMEKTLEQILVLTDKSLITANDKKLLEENKAKLTPEQLKFFEMEVKVEPSDKKVEDKQFSEKITAAEAKIKELTDKVQAFEAKAKEAQVAELKAKEELEKKSLDEEYTKLLFSEKGPKIIVEKKQTVLDFVYGLNADQRKTFSEIMTALPEVQIFGEKGKLFDAKVDVNGSELDSAVKACMKANSGMTYPDALKKVQKEKPELTKYGLNKD